MGTPDSIHCLNGPFKGTTWHSCDLGDACIPHRIYNNALFVVNRMEDVFDRREITEHIFCCDDTQLTFKCGLLLYVDFKSSYNRLYTSVFGEYRDHLRDYVDLYLKKGKLPLPNKLKSALNKVPRMLIEDKPYFT